MTGLEVGSGRSPVRRRRGPRSLRARVTAVGVVTLLVVLGLGALVTVRALAAALRDDLAAQNEEILDALALAIAEGADPTTLRIPLGADGTDFAILDDDGRLVNASALAGLPEGVEIVDLFGVSAVVVNDAGLVVEGFSAGVGPVEGSVVTGALGPLEPVLVAPPIGFEPGQAEAFGFDRNDFVEAGDWFQTERSVQTPEGDQLTIQAYSPLGVIGRSVDRLAWTMVVLVPLLAVAGGVALWQTIGVALSPVGRIAEEARRIAPSTSGDRLPVPDSGDEIAELTATLNEMLDRLDAGLVRQRQFVSDASHELRSPLTVVRGAAELLADRDLPAEADPSVGRLQRGVERLEAVLDDLTQLASAGEPTARQPVDLADAVLHEVELVRAAANDQAATGQVEVVGLGDGSDGGSSSPRPQIDTRRIEVAVVSVNAVQLGRAVNNLVANAVRHAESRVAVAAHLVDGGVEIVVDDDGPGVAPADRGRIFDRFVRLDSGRARDGGGTGLGLALVASIAADHGGSVVCTDSPLGGARFVLRLAV